MKNQVTMRAIKFQNIKEHYETKAKTTNSNTSDPASQSNEFISSPKRSDVVYSQLEKNQFKFEQRKSGEEKQEIPLINLIQPKENEKSPHGRIKISQAIWIPTRSDGTSPKKLADEKSGKAFFAKDDEYDYGNEETEMQTTYIKSSIENSTKRGEATMLSNEVFNDAKDIIGVRILINFLLNF